MRSILMDSLRLAHRSVHALTASNVFGNVNASNEFRQITLHFFMRNLPLGIRIPRTELCDLPFIFIIEPLADLNAKTVFGITFQIYTVRFKV